MHCSSFREAHARTPDAFTPASPRAHLLHIARPARIARSPACCARTQRVRALPDALPCAPQVRMLAHPAACFAQVDRSAVSVAPLSQPKQSAAVAWCDRRQCDRRRCHLRPRGQQRTRRIGGGATGRTSGGGAGAGAVISGIGAAASHGHRRRGHLWCGQRLALRFSR